MGCASSQDAFENRARLDKVKNTLAKDGAPGQLEVLASAAAELKAVFDVICSGGAKDRSGMERIQLISEDVLAGLRTFVTPELVKAPDFTAREAKLMRIAFDLDSVRATKASEAIKSLVDAERGKVVAASELDAREDYGQMVRIVAGITKPEQVLPQVALALDKAESAHAAAPTSKKVADLILQNLVKLTQRILSKPSVSTWGKTAQLTREAVALSSRLDAVAEKLVFVMEDKWDPPLAREVETLAKKVAEAECKALLKTAGAELSRSNAGACYDNLDTVKDWWPLLKDTGSMSLEVVGLFSKIQSYAVESFMKATRSGDKETADSIREFAKKVDKMRSTFEGLPPAVGGPLVEMLQAGEVRSTAERHLDALDKEVAKTSDDDASTNLSLSATVQALEALASIWEHAAALENAEALITRLAKTCAGVEAWAEKAASACKAKDRLLSLLRFAEEYDGRRQRLTPPDAERGPLRPRIALTTANIHLNIIEKELKAPALNPELLLEGLRGAGLTLTLDDTGDTGSTTKVAEAKAKLQEACKTTEGRIQKSFGEACHAGNERKSNALLRFASDFDEIGGLVLAGAGGGKGLGSVLRADAKGLADERLQAFEQELKKKPGEADLQSASVAGALKALVALWAILPEDEMKGSGGFWGSAPPQERLKAALSTLGDHLEQAAVIALLATEAKPAVEAVLTLAADLDASISALLPDDAETLKCRPKLVDAAAQRQLDAATAQLAASVDGDEALDLAKLEDALLTMQPLLKESSAAKVVAIEFLDKLGAPLTSAYNIGLAERAADKAAAATKVAEAADATRLVAGGTEGTLAKQLQASRAAVARLDEILEELAKPAGMNPVAVKNGLEELAPQWQQLGECEGLRQRLEEALQKFADKLVEACKKAVEQKSDTKKLEALMDFARGGDKVQQALVEATSQPLQVRQFHAALSRVVVSDRLAVMEVEVAKDQKSRDPKVLLITLQGLNTFWAHIEGDSSATDAEAADAAALLGRLQEIHSQLQKLLKDSMKTAIEGQQEPKKQGLLKFAEQWDASYDAMVPVKHEALEDSLKKTIAENTENLF